MDKINFQDGTKVSDAKVTIDGTDYPVTPAVYSGTTPFSSYNLNKMQSNIENSVNAIEQELQNTHNDTLVADIGIKTGIQNRIRYNSLIQPAGGINNICFFSLNSCFPESASNCFSIVDESTEEDTMKKCVTKCGIAIAPGVKAVKLEINILLNEYEDNGHAALDGKLELVAVFRPRNRGWSCI